MTRCAIVDIGSNTLRYAEGCLVDEKAEFYTEKLIRMTRLAEGERTTGMLNSASINRSMAALHEFCDIASSNNLPIFCYATSAVREASNQTDFLKLVRRETGIDVDVLSGEREAELAYLGATGGSGGMIDIGGGSMQIAYENLRVSAPIGCVRALEIAAPFEKFADARMAIEQALDGYLTVGLKNSDTFIGVGGTITTLAALNLGLKSYDRLAVHNAVLTLGDVEGIIHELDLAGEQRKNNPLLSLRHDTILPGAAILSYEMRRLAIKTLIASERDGMEGYLKFALTKVIHKGFTH